MTPNPQNIGAAPEEYPIRGLCKAEAWGVGSALRGAVTQWQDVGHGYKSAPGCFDPEDESDHPYSWFVTRYELIIDPTPEQIAEERAKAGLPPQEGEALPEPQAKGPSLPEVTQPGEGVDLEDGVGAELADYFERLGIREKRQAWVNTLYLANLRLLAMTLGQRALRRESK